MMPRIPEPELMDSVEQAEAYARADFGDVNQGFVDRFLERFPEARGGRFVDLGCGPADIPIRLCRRLPEVYVVGIDGADEMLEPGRRAIREAGLEGRVTLEVRNLPLSEPSGARFDAGLSNSLLHHLHDPAVLWRSLRELLAPGAPILVVDLFRPPSRTEAEALVETYARDEAPVLREDFFNSLLAAFTPTEVRTQFVAAGLGHLEIETISDRHLAVSGRL